MIAYKLNPGKEEWNVLLQRPTLKSGDLEQVVKSILVAVRKGGDEAVKKYTMQFDQADLTELQVSSQEILEAVDLVDDRLKNAILLAKHNIEKFHLAQLKSEPAIEIMPGVTCWRKQIPIQKVGLYIPGGSAPLFSTLLMLAVPAVIAGCKEIIVCTPPQSTGNINPVVLFVASLLGIKTIYKVGGVQAIAAMAYGTATIPAVNKIFGPGNQYVTASKQMVCKEGTAIDMPAGPSEVAIYADASSIPAFVAADLLSQAEHGADSQVVLVAENEDLMKKIIQELELQIPETKRAEEALASISASRFIVMKDIDHAFDLLNEYAPEHLIIASDNASSLAEKVINAGSVFLGNFTPEAAGDYASGTNHTLPTNGYAKAYSGVSVESFMKLVSFQQLTESGLSSLSPAIESMAEAEGLFAHKNAVAIRRNNSFNNNR